MMAADRYRSACRRAVVLAFSAAIFLIAGLASSTLSTGPSRLAAAAAVLPVKVPARSSQLVAAPVIPAGYGEPHPRPAVVGTHTAHQHHLAVVAAASTPAPVPPPEASPVASSPPAAAPVQSSAPAPEPTTASTATASPQAGPGGGAGAELLNKAMSMQGVPYVYGGDTPGGFDCSGLVYWAAQQLGISAMPRDTFEMLAQGTSSGLLVQVAAPEYGDLAFFGSGHVEFYVKPGETFGAQSPGTAVGFHPYGSGYAPSAFYRVT
jgi:cell wall-associated NlpC family hydrolase